MYVDTYSRLDVKKLQISKLLIKLICSNNTYIHAPHINVIVALRAVIHTYIHDILIHTSYYCRTWTEPITGIFHRKNVMEQSLSSDSDFWSNCRRSSHTISSFQACVHAHADIRTRGHAHSHTHTLSHKRAHTNTHTSTISPF